MTNLTWFWWFKEDWCFVKWGFVLVFVIWDKSHILWKPCFIVANINTYISCTSSGARSNLNVNNTPVTVCGLSIAWGHTAVGLRRTFGLLICGHDCYIRSTIVSMTQITVALTLSVTWITVSRTLWPGIHLVFDWNVCSTFFVFHWGDAHFTYFKYHN